MTLASGDQIEPVEQVPNVFVAQGPSMISTLTELDRTFEGQQGERTIRLFEELGKKALEGDLAASESKARVDEQDAATLAAFDRIMQARASGAVLRYSPELARRLNDEPLAVRVSKLLDDDDNARKKPASPHAQQPVQLTNERRRELHRGYDCIMFALHGKLLREMPLSARPRRTIPVTPLTPEEEHSRGRTHYYLGSPTRDYGKIKNARGYGPADTGRTKG